MHTVLYCQTGLQPKFTDIPTYTIYMYSEHDEYLKVSNNIFVPRKKLIFLATTPRPCLDDFITQLHRDLNSNNYKNAYGHYIMYLGLNLPYYFYNQLTGVVVKNQWMKNRAWHFPNHK